MGWIAFDPDGLLYIGSGVDQARNFYIVEFDGEIYVIEPN
jgi:hypothetical protein